MLCARSGFTGWGGVVQDLRMDECHGERDLVDWPPAISLTQDGHKGNSVGSERNFSSSQIEKAVKGAKKQIARQAKNRNRRDAQRKKKRELP